MTPQAIKRSMGSHWLNNRQSAQSVRSIPKLLGATGTSRRINMPALPLARSLDTITNVTVRGRGLALVAFRLGTSAWHMWANIMNNTVHVRECSLLNQHSRLDNRILFLFSSTSLVSRMLDGLCLLSSNFRLRRPLAFITTSCHLASLSTIISTFAW